MMRAEAEARVKAQLALDFCCEPGDFDREENMITPAAALEGRRRFSDKPFFLQMATFGGNAVISADEALHPWLRAWVRDKKGFWLFEQHNYLALDRELLRHGYEMALTHHMFLPLPEAPAEDPALPVRWLEQGDLGPWYGREEFSNALCDRFRPERPDVLAVIALDGEAVMGMAGCSADAPDLWQIGVDVLPEYRRRGVGRALVTLLRNEVLRRGAVPYYGTSLSNLASWKVALASGFGPAWIEAEAREAKERSFAK